MKEDEEEEGHTKAQEEEEGHTKTQVVEEGHIKAQVEEVEEDGHNVPYGDGPQGC